MTDSVNEARWALYAEQSRRHPEDPWYWHLAHRGLNGRPFFNMGALAGIIRDDHPFVVIQKSSQVGVTESLVSLALWAADRGYAGRGNALFLMPTANQMADFAQGRFDRAIQESSYLRSRLRPDPPKRKGADNTRLKQIGSGFVYLRGSESARQVASVDADIVILDEYDQMADGIIDLARRRVASSQRGLVRVASTPRFPETGINGLFLQSDQRYYEIPCGNCGREQALTFAGNVDPVRMAIVCRECRERLDVLKPGRWVSRAPSHQVHGYHLSRLYSPWLDVHALVEASQDQTLAATEQFQNGDLGEVFSPPGGSVSLAELDAARVDYSLSDYAGEPTTMGVDVGARLHVVIRRQPTVDERHRHREGGPRPPRALWFAGEVSGFGELDALMLRFHVASTVIDGQPQGHAATAFAERHPRSVWLAQYHYAPGHERVPSVPRRYRINRTEALEQVFSAFRTGEARLPANARELGGRVKQGIGEYYREVMAQVRTLERDATGNWESRYVDLGKADHYAHAEVYCAMAAETPLPARVSVSSG